MYQQTASKIPKYHSAMNIHSAVVESLICGQMKKLTQVNAVCLAAYGPAIVHITDYCNQCTN